MYKDLEILKSYKNIIFDLDNTLYDQRDFDFEAYTQLFDSSLLAKKLIEYKQKMPYGYTKLFNDFIKEENLGTSVKECVEFYRSYEPKLAETPSLVPFLNSLDSNLYLISNGYKKLQMAKIKALNLRDIFKKIIILDPLENSKLKPNPESFFELDIATKDSIYVGDNLMIDKEFAKNAKIDFCHFIFINKGQL